MGNFRGYSSSLEPSKELVFFRPPLSNTILYLSQYDLCEDEETLDCIEAEMSRRGVTQELIDETRAATETQMVKDLTEIAARGGDLEYPDKQGASPLHIASANGYTKVVEFLLENHVNVDATDKDLWSPVHAAACWGHVSTHFLLFF